MPRLSANWGSEAIEFSTPRDPHFQGWAGGPWEEGATVTDRPKADNATSVFREAARRRFFEAIRTHYSSETQAALGPRAVKALRPARDVLDSLAQAPLDAYRGMSQIRLIF